MEVSEPPSMGSMQDAFSDLQQHLSDVENSPTTALDVKLIDRSQLQLSGVLNNPEAATHVTSLLQQISSLLPKLQQDPRPLVDLLIKVSEPLSFEQILQIEPPVEFREGLRKENQPFNLLVLNLLEKATLSPHYAAIVAGQRDTVKELVRLWLSTEQTDVAEKASQVIARLLEVDLSSHYSGDGDIDMADTGSVQTRPAGSGLMWRRVFGDRDIYGMIFSICAVRGSKGVEKLSKNAKTLAQARLMNVLPRIASLDWSAVTHSQFPEIEASYGMPQGREGLLDFAAGHMVDIADDVLMHITLIDFYADLLKTVSPDTSSLSSSTTSLTARNSSPALDFLISRGLHNRTAAYYLDSNNPALSPLDVSFLFGRSAKYIAIYVAHFPGHLLATDKEAFVSYDKILRSIGDELHRPLSRWAGEAPQWSLHLLSSLPLVALMPSQADLVSPQPAQIWRSHLLSQIPVKPANAAALHTLLTLFYGKDPSSSEGEQAARTATDLAAARVLYALYVSNTPDFYKSLVSLAQTLALKEQALAAITLITGVISAKWAQLPTSTPTYSSQSSFALPTETQLSLMLPPGSTPPPLTGVEAMLASPAAETVIPWLLEPAQSFSNLVGGGRGDAESAAYKVGMAKYGALKAFWAAVKEFRDEHGEYPRGARSLESVVTRRLAEGPWGSMDRETGGRVGTLEL